MDTELLAAIVAGFTALGGAVAYMSRGYIVLYNELKEDRASQEEAKDHALKLLNKVQDRLSEVQLKYAEAVELIGKYRAEYIKLKAAHDELVEEHAKCLTITAMDPEEMES